MNNNSVFVAGVVVVVILIIGAWMWFSQTQPTVDTPVEPEAQSQPVQDFPTGTTTESASSTSY